MSWQNIVCSIPLRTKGTQTTEVPEFDTSVGIVPLVPRVRIREHSLKDPLAWSKFMMMCTSQGVTTAEVTAMFSDADKADLIEEPEHKLPLHAKTIVNAIKAKRKAVVAEMAVRRYVVNPIPVTRCLDCQHFDRIDHPHLGHCRIKAQAEATCGLWDTDPRDYCDKWEV